MPNSIFNEERPVNYYVRLDDTQSETFVKLVETSDHCLRLDALLISNSDSIDHICEVYLNFNGPQLVVGTVNVPAGSGFSGVPPVDFCATSTPISLGGIVVSDYYDIYVFVRGVIGSATNIDFLAFGGRLD